MQFSEIDFTSVAIATVAAFILGFLWYGPLFGKSWRALNGIDEENKQDSHPLLVFGPAIILTFILGLVLSALMPSGMQNWFDGAVFGTLLGIGLIAASFGINYLFARKPISLFMIDAGYYVITMAIFGAIIAVMN